MFFNSIVYRFSQRRLETINNYTEYFDRVRVVVGKYKKEKIFGQPYSMLIPRVSCSWMQKCGRNLIEYETTKY